MATARSWSIDTTKRDSTSRRSMERKARGDLDANASHPQTAAGRAGIFLYAPNSQQRGQRNHFCLMGGIAVGRLRCARCQYGRPLCPATITPVFWKEDSSVKIGIAPGKAVCCPWGMLRGRNWRHQKTETNTRICVALVFFLTAQSWQHSLWRCAYSSPNVPHCPPLTSSACLGS